MGYLFDEVKLAADGLPQISRLTAEQKAKVRAIAQSDPTTIKTNTPGGARMVRIPGETRNSWAE